MVTTNHKQKKQVGEEKSGTWRVNMKSGAWRLKGNLSKIIWYNLKITFWFYCPMAERIYRKWRTRERFINSVKTSCNFTVILQCSFGNKSSFSESQLQRSEWGDLYLCDGVLHWIYFVEGSKVSSVGNYFRQCDQQACWFFLGPVCKTFKLFIHWLLW